MRYSSDHKTQTHQRIIKEASVRFRRDGIGATGLQPLMKVLNLTMAASTPTSSPRKNW